MNPNRVKDRASCRVILSEGFKGICTGFFPQYLMMAILEGHDQPSLPSILLAAFPMVDKVIKPKNYVDISLMKIVMELFCLGI